MWNSNEIIKTNAPVIQSDACQWPIHFHCVSGRLPEQDIKITRSKCKYIKLVGGCYKHNRLSSFRDLKMLFGDFRAELSSIGNFKRELEEEMNTINQHPAGTPNTRVKFCPGIVHNLYQ